MLKKTALLAIAFTLASCGQQPHNQSNAQNPVNTTNGMNRQIDCTPITNPNYVPGGNQAQYYYPEGCQSPNGMNGNMQANQANNGSGIGGYVGAAAVGAAAGALASHAMNKNKNNTPVAVNTPTNNSPNVATARANAPATMNTSNQATARAAAPTSMNRATATAPAFAPATVRPSAGIQNNRMSSRRR